MLSAEGRGAVAAHVSYDCNPCLERRDFTIRAILHGTKNDPFWGQIVNPMWQIAEDMRVKLEVLGLSSNSFDENQMVSDILGSIDKNSDVNALLVTIPTTKVQTAVQRAIDSGMPVFGLNSGYDRYLPGLLGHVAMDDRLGGNKAAEQFLLKWTNQNVTSAGRKVLYINYEKYNQALSLRLKGLTDKFQGSVTVEEAVVDRSSSGLQSQLDALLESCPYDGILLAGGQILEQVLAAYYTNKCNFEKQILGTFDANSKIYDAIAVSKVTFLVSQQQHLQDSLSMLMATLYATTGKSLLENSSEAQSGNYQSGPKIITISELPTDSQQVCESESFPICRYKGKEESRGRCECTDRSRIRIGAVLSDRKSSPFWEYLWQAAEQAAMDMGVELVLDVLERPGNFDTENAKTAEKVKVRSKNSFVDCCR